ncbi:MAG TPA: CorA family divalent cation transporter [Caulobacterales bacterium]|nr:CorA family divalent cation transporter [Caulobacterales bacterium]
MIRILAKGGAEAANLDDPAALWIDLENPTAEEEKSVEAALSIDVPTPTERSAFEESARFYEENGALFLTATLLGRRDEGPFVSGAVTFVLVKGKLVTVRQIRPRAFEIGQTRASARVGAAQTGADAAVALLEGAVERLADILGETTTQITAFSTRLFGEHQEPYSLRESLRALGRIGLLTSMAHDSLSSLQRLTAYARHVCDRHGLNEAQLNVLQRDVEELEHQAEALQARISYLQDATLGIINSIQADVIKALSLATIAFVPPTLIASIFGMNFVHMTWFQKPWGAPVAFLLMLLAPGALLGVAKWRRWF